MDVSRRKQLAREKGACFKCLGQGHLIRNCKTKLKCQKDQCQGSHHTLLHRDQENKDDDCPEENEENVATVHERKQTRKLKDRLHYPLKESWYAARMAKE